MGLLTGFHFRSLDRGHEKGHVLQRQRKTAPGHLGRHGSGSYSLCVLPRHMSEPERQFSANMDVSHMFSAVPRPHNYHLTLWGRNWTVICCGVWGLKVRGYTSMCVNDASRRQPPFSITVFAHLHSRNSHKDVSSKERTAAHK